MYLGDDRLESFKHQVGAVLAVRGVVGQRAPAQTCGH